MVKKKKWLRCLCSFLLILSFLYIIGGSVETVLADEANMNTSGYFYVNLAYYAEWE